MKLIKTEESVGCVIPHDMTEIVKDKRKGVLFKKGHVITKEDIPRLLDIGKEHIYVFELDEGMMHEDDAAKVLERITKGENLSSGAVSEGKIELTAEIDGLLKVNVGKLDRINALGEMMIATRVSGFPVKKGDKVAGMRAIPLVISKEKMREAEKIAAGEKIISVKPFAKMDYGLITTGNEIKKKRISDTFSPVIAEKLSEFGSKMVDHAYPGDDEDEIVKEIKRMENEGLGLIILTGGMSVDPDDRTPGAIKKSGAEVVSYGSPVLPGAMLLVAYFGKTTILGLPGCVMYSKRTVFDIVLPHVMAGERITREFITSLGNGGLCLSCPVCHYPNCSFGKGGADV